MFNKQTVRSVRKMAEAAGVEAEALLAVAEVESAGKAVWSVNGTPRPPIRFEGHYFYRLLPPSKRAQAVRRGLAAKRWGVVKNPNSYAGRYTMLAKAAQIHDEAAYASISIGLGQVMGEHATRLGFSSAKEMFAYASKSVANQVDIMLRFIKHFKLTDELNTHNWASFARQYNGKSYKVNKYDIKMAQAYTRWKGGASANVRGRALVVEYQEQLQTLGYYRGRVDGMRGPNTIKALKAFQADHGLVEDGIYGMMTGKALEKAITEKAIRKADQNIELGTGTAGAGTGGGGISVVLKDVAEKFEPLTPYSDYLLYLFIIITAVGVIITGYNMYRKRKLENGDVGVFSEPRSFGYSEGDLDFGADLPGAYS